MTNSDRIDNMSNVIKSMLAVADLPEDRVEEIRFGWLQRTIPIGWNSKRITSKEVDSLQKTYWNFKEAIIGEVTAYRKGKWQKSELIHC